MRTGRGTRFGALIALLASCGFAAPARAGFVDGVERFDGTALDTATWRTRTTNGETLFSQDDAITIDTLANPDAASMGDYVTQSRTVGIGGSARVDVTVHARTPPTLGADYVQLVLTSKTAGDVDITRFDRGYFLLAAQFTAAPDQQGVFGGADLPDNTFAGGERVDGAPASITPGEVALETRMVFQIERLTRTRARYSVFERESDGGARLVGFTTREFGQFASAADMPDDLFVSIGAAGTRVTFDDVTLDQPLPVVAVIPLPPAAWAGAAGLLLAVAGAGSVRRRVVQ